MMSATNRGAKRNYKDFYRTPEWAVHRLLDVEGQNLIAGRWCDPGAGEGAIMSAVNSYDGGRYARKILWHAVEVRRNCARQLRAIVGPDRPGDEPSLVIGDCLRYRPRTNFAVSLGNPPFIDAQEFVEWARRHSAIVGLLLRLGFLESEARASWWEKNMPSRIRVLPNRPTFGMNKHGRFGTDATTYAWFLWGLGQHMEGAALISVLAPTPKEERRRALAALAEAYRIPRRRRA